MCIRDRAWADLASDPQPILRGRRIGLQIIGRRHDDLGVLHVARAFESLRAALRPWPQPPACSD